MREVLWSGVFQERVGWGLSPRGHAQVWWEWELRCDGDCAGGTGATGEVGVVQAVPADVAYGKRRREVRQLGDGRAFGRRVRGLCVVICLRDILGGGL